MKKRSNRLTWLCSLLALISVCLSGCSVPPDQISGNTQNMNTSGTQILPYASLAPFATATPAPSPTTNPWGNTGNNNWSGTNTGTQGSDNTWNNQPTQGNQAMPTINWNNNWGTSATPTPGIQWNTQGGSTPTVNWNTGVTPRPGTIATITRTPATATPRPNATATPSVLKKGAEGSEVRKLQQRLKDLGYLSGSADGSFGEATEDAVIAFQKANRLTADGVAGTQTLQKLNSANAVPYSKQNNTNRATATPKRATATPKPKATPTINPEKYKYLEPGQSGTNVRKLQERLISLGWMDGKADGEYDGATEMAVRAFQKKAGLWVDGKAGPETQAKLYASSAPKSSTPVSSTGESLKEGSSSDAVRTLQRRLKDLGYYTGSIDGDYGTGTAEAVKAFQKRNGLSADGVAGTKTLNKIYAADARSAGSESTGNDGGSTSGNPITLREGDSGDRVKTLQSQLKKLGYYTGSTDGKYGPSTAAAVATFQKRNDLKSDGVAGPVTQELLFGNDSETVYNTLRPGDEGSAVSKMQYALYELGYYDGKRNGIYGDSTTDAVRAFQINNKLTPVDGVAGNKTLQRLYSKAAVSATAYNPDYTTLRPGMKGNDVVEMQDVLIQLGYMSAPTGVYDSATENAVRKFQQRNGLTVDGVAGSTTLSCLYGNNPKRAN